MKHHHLITITLGLALGSTLHSQTPVPTVPPPPRATPVEGTEASAYEDGMVLQAGMLLQSSFVSSPLFKVRDQVTTNMGVNEFVIDSQFGVMLAHGNVMLEERVSEIEAMAKLDSMEKGKEFGNAVKQAAKKPIKAVESLIDDPGGTLAQVPKGIGKFFNRLSRNVKEAVDDRPRNEYEDTGVKNALGVARAKRELCKRLGINPYSSNELLQKKLDDMGWVLFAGNLTVSAATMPLDGGAAAIVSSTKFIGNTTAVIYEQSPTDLRLAHKATLMQMGLRDAETEAFLANPSFSPWHQTVLVTALQAIPDVKGRDVFVRDATAMSAHEADAIFYAQTANLLGRVHASGTKIDRIELVNNVPVCIARDGTLLLVLHWDYARWTPAAERFSGVLVGTTISGAKPPGIAVAMSGIATPRLKQELQARGIRLTDRLDVGPMN